MRQAIGDEPPAINAYPRKLSCQVGGALTGLVQKSDLRIAFHKNLSHLPGGLGHFADDNSITQNQPPIVYPSLIATVQQMSLHLFCVRTTLSVVPFVSDR